MNITIDRPILSICIVIISTYLTICGALLVHSYNSNQEIEYNKKLLDETKLSKPSESYKNYKEPRETINHCRIPYHKERIVEYKELMVGTNTYINNQEIMKKVIKKSTLYACVNNEKVISHPNYESLKWKGKYTKMDGTLLTVIGYIGNGIYR